VSDFITELRREVLEAHAAQQRRTLRRRAARRLRLGLWPPAMALRAAAVAACAVALVIAVRPVLAPEPPARLRIVAVVPVGGLLTDGALAGGSLWVADSEVSAVVRVDLDARAVAARIPLRDDPSSLVPSAPGGLWIGTQDPAGHGTGFAHLDLGSGRVIARFFAQGGACLAVGADRLWVGGLPAAPGGIGERDPRTGRLLRRIPFPNVDGLAFSGDALWAIAHNGTLAQIDAPTGRIVRRWPLLAPSDAHASSEGVLAADATGVWALSTENASIVRVEDGRIVRRVPVEPEARPLLARTPGALWYAEGSEYRARYRLHRLDPVSGEPTGTVAITSHRPIALVPVGDRLAVVAGDGSVLLVEA
jgi:hypothetical protein